jgi:hypothetical protein
MVSLNSVFSPSEDQKKHSIKADEYVYQQRNGIRSRLNTVCFA